MLDQSAKDDSTILSHKRKDFPVFFYINNFLKLLFLFSIVITFFIPFEDNSFKIWFLKLLELLSPIMFIFLAVEALIELYIILFANTPVEGKAIAACKFCVKYGASAYLAKSIADHPLADPQNKLVEWVNIHGGRGYTEDNWFTRQKLQTLNHLMAKNGHSFDPSSLANDHRMVTGKRLDEFIYENKKILDKDFSVLEKSAVAGKPFISNPLLPDLFSGRKE